MEGNHFIKKSTQIKRVREVQFTNGKHIFKHKEGTVKGIGHTKSKCVSWNHFNVKDDFAKNERLRYLRFEEMLVINL